MVIESLCSQYRYLLALDSKQVLTNFYDLHVDLSVLRIKLTLKSNTYQLTHTK